MRVASGSLSGTVILNDTFLSHFVVTGYIPNSAINSVSGLGSNLVSLNLNASVLNSTFTGVRLQILVRAKCGANGLSSAPHGMLLTAGGGVNISRPGADFVSAVKAPTLIVENRGPVDITNATIGTTYIRKWRIRNTGTNSTIDTIWIRNIYQQYTQFDHLIIGGFPVAPTAIHGDTVWYKLVRTLRNQSVFAGDTVIMEESFKVTACTDPSGSSQIAVYWGCFDSPICNITQRFPSTQIPLTVPDLKARLVSRKYGCYNSYDTVTLAYYNTGGNATDIKMRFDLCYPIPAYQNDPDISSAIGFIDTASIKVKLNTSGTYVHQSPDSMVRYDNSRTFWPESHPAGIVYLKRASLNQGDTVYVSFRIFRGAYTDAYCQATEIFLNTHISFKNNCGNASYVVPMTHMQGEAHRFYGKINYNAPAYLVFGDTGTFEFTTLRGSHFSHYQSNKSLFMLRIELPAGLKWDGDTSIMKLSRVGDPSMNKRVDSWSWNVGTRVLELYYKMPSDNTYAVSTKVNLFLDCSVPGAGGTQSIFAQYFRIPQVNNCLWQKLPYSCKDANPVTMICPSPCPRGGVVPYMSEFRRSTFGLPDNDQNGIPDGAGSIDMSKVEWNKLAPRDTFKLTYKGWIARGSQSPAAFTNGYGRIWIPNYGNLVSAVSAKITIKDLSAGTTFTVNSLPVSVLDTGSRRTFVYDFSNTLSGFPGGYIFDHNDSFTFEATYIYNTNVTENANPDDAVTATVSLYVSHLTNPTNDTARYRCLDLPATYRVVNVYKGYNGGFTARPVGCTQVAVYSDFFQSVGDCCSNYAGSVHFPYEYRLFTTLDTLKIRIPAGYILDSTNLIYNYTAGAGKSGSKRFYGITPLSINGEWYTFLVTKLYDFAGGTQVPSTTGSYWVMYNYVTPSCSLPVGNIQTQFTADRWIGKTTWTGITTRGVAANHNRGTYEYTEAAQLDISNFGATNLLAINKVASWDVKLQNSAVNAISKNTWLGFYSNTGGIVVDSVRNMTTNALLAQSGGIFRVGDIAGGGTNGIYRIYSHYNACIYDSLKIFTGWTCQAYPVNLAAAISSCRSDSTKVYIQPLNPLVQTDLISQPPDPINLCDTLNWVLSVSSRQVAAAYNLSLDVIFPNGGTGSIIVPSFGYKYPYNSPTYQHINPVFIGSGVYRFNLSDSIPLLKANGIRPIGEAPNNELYLNVRALTNCNFTSGSSVRFIINAKKACGNNLTPDAEFDPVNISGAPAPKLYLGGTINTPIPTCDKDVDVRISVRNLELAATGANDRLVVTLPSGVTYTPSSVVFTRNALTPATPVITNPGGLQQLTWNLSGVPAGDSTVLTIKVSSPANTACGSINTISLATKSDFVATCGVGVCNSQVQNWEEIKNMPVLKPDVRFINGTMRIVKDTTIGNKFMPDTIQAQNLQFTNMGTDTANQVYFQFFHDVNGNKTKDPAELVWARDTLFNVLPGQTKYLNWTKIFGHNSVPDSLRLYINSPCNCTQSAFVVSPTTTYIPLLVKMGGFTVTKSGTNAQLDWNVWNETNIKFYELERFNPETSRFEFIGKVNAQNNGSIAQFYRYLDDLRDIKTNRVFYRIKIVDQWMKYAYSEIRELQLQSKPFIANVVPNPSNGNFIVQLTGLAGEMYQIDILDMQGKSVIPNAISGVMATENESHTLQATQLSAGMYFIQIKTEGKIQLQKIIIQK